MNATFYLLCIYSTVLLAKLTIEEVHSLIVCYKTKMEPLKGSEKYDLTFSNFDRRDLYKMFIDKGRLENPYTDEIMENSKPKYLFDRGNRGQPGYYKGMKNAFELVRAEIGNKITLEMLIKFHDTAVGQIADMEKGTGTDFCYYTKIDRIDPNAIKELVDSGIAFSPKELLENISNGRNIVSKDFDASFLDRFKDFYLSVTSIGPEGMGFNCNLSNDPRKIWDKLWPFVAHYYFQILDNRTLEGKIAAIAELLRALEVAHFFPDGNQRTYAFLLLNKLLIDNNIPPAILDNPTIFDGWCTLETMITEIYNGIENFLNNDFGRQKLFLSDKCQISASSEEAEYYLERYEYAPFYEKGHSKRQESIISSTLINEIGESLYSEKLEEPDEFKLKPLHKAMILGDDGLVEELLSLGAKPLSEDESCFDSPFFYMLKYFNFEIAMNLVFHLDFKKIDQNTLEYVEASLKGIMKSNNSEEIKWKIKEIIKLLKPGDNGNNGSSHKFGRLSQS